LQLIGADGEPPHAPRIAPARRDGRCFARVWCDVQAQGAVA
jgi:hypothetical protein